VVEAALERGEMQKKLEVVRGQPEGSKSVTEGRATYRNRSEAADPKLSVAPSFLHSVGGALGGNTGHCFSVEHEYMQLHPTVCGYD
jgi:hypothetical protein